MANVTSSGNTTIKPTINTAKFMGSSYAAGSSLENKFANIYSSLSTLAIKIKKNFDNINLLTETIQNASLHSHTDNDDSDGDNKDNISNDDNSKLDEINSILLDIGDVISLDFANRIAENKEDISDTRKEKSKGKFERAESGIEKQKQRKVGNIFTKTASKAASPISGIFGKLLALGGILGTGIMANAAFDWLRNKENQEKMSTFFKIVKKNWKWMLGTAGILIGAAIVLKTIAAITVIGGVLAAISNPVFLGILAIAASGMGVKWMLDRINDYYADDPTGKKNFVGNPIPGAPKDALPGDFWTDKKGQTWVKQPYDSSNGGWNKTNDTPEEILETQTKAFKAGFIKRIGINLNKPTITSSQRQDLSYLNNDKKRISFVNLDLPPNYKNENNLIDSSSVATEVAHISAKNLSDPYIQLSPEYYGIHV